MRRTLLSLTSVLLSLSALVGVGFSAYYFTSGTSVSTAEEFVPHVDNLPDNFSLDESQDYYDLFFFPQPYAANSVTPDGGNNPTYTTRAANSANWYYPTGITGHNYNGGQETNSVTFEWGLIDYQYTLRFGNYCQGSGGDYDGYWTSGDHNPKHLNVYRHLSNEALVDIGFPSSSMKDAYGWTLGFSGWTCNRQSAIDDGYAKQSGFDLFNTQTDLSTYDRMLPDGSVVPQTEVSNYATTRGIDGSYIGDNRLYLYPIFSTGKDYGHYIQSGNDDNNLGFAYNAFDDARNHTQQVSPMIDSVGFESQGQTIWADQIDSSSNCFLLRNVQIGEGTSVRIAPVYYSDSRDASGGTNQWDGVWHYISMGDLPAGQYNCYVFVQSEFRENYNSNLSYPDELNTKIDANRILETFDESWTSDAGKTRAVVMVERLYDFKLIGGITGTLDYNAETTYFANRTSDIGAEVKYEIHDIYFPGTENYHRRGLADGYFYNDYVFSIASSSDWRSMDYSVSCPANDPLLTTNLTPGVDYDVGKDSGKVVAMVGRGGMYDLELTITFKNVAGQGNNHNIESIEILAQPSENDFSILIYENESGIAEKNGFFDSGSSTGLLGQASFSVQDGSVPSLTGSTLFGGQTFESIVNAHGGYFYDYVTGRRFSIADLSDGSFQVTKSYVFYLNPDGGAK